MGAHLFEVMYIGKVKVKDKKAPPTIIDEAVEMFQTENLRRKQLQFLMESERQRHASETSVRSLPANLEKSVRVRENELSIQNAGHQNTSTDSCLSGNTFSSEQTNSSSSTENIANGNNISFEGFPDKDVHTSEESIKGNEDVDGNQNEKLEVVKGDGKEDSISMSSSEEEQRSNPAAPPGGCGLQSQTNRVLLIQVCQYEVCLISPDKKTVIMERKFKDISFCFQVCLLLHVLHILRASFQWYQC